MPCPLLIRWGDLLLSLRSAVKIGTVESSTRTDRRRKTYPDILIFSRGFDAQRNTFQRGTKNLGYRKRCHVFLLLPRVQFVAYARLSTACSSSTLSGSCTGYPLLCQNRKPSLRVVVCFLGLSPVNDIDHIIDSDGRLSETMSGTNDMEL